MDCKNCDKKDSSSDPINETMEYSGIEISLSPYGTLRVRHYPTLSYDDNFDTQDVINIKFCPLCGREFQRPAIKSLV